MRIIVDQPDREELEEMDVFSWPVMEHDEEKFDCFYDKTEYCYIVTGEATITSEFESITVKPGDFIEFPAGLECVWDVQSSMKKHYNYE